MGQWWDGLSPDEQENFIRKHIPYAKKIARMVVRNNQALYDEAEASAFDGLFDAAKRFDPAKGAKFTTFAQTRIKGEIYDNLQPDVPRFKGERLTYTFLEKVEKALLEKLGNEPTIYEIAEEIIKEKFDYLTEAERKKETPKLVERIEMIRSSPTPIDNIKEKTDSSDKEAEKSEELKELLHECIKKLKEIYKEVIIIHYYEEMPLTEIAEKKKDNYDTVKTHHDRAKKELEKCLSQKGISITKEGRLAF